MRVRLAGAALALAGLATIAALVWFPLRGFDGLIWTHIQCCWGWTTLVTWASELWIQTDFIGPARTVVAWVALGALVGGLWLAVWPGGVRRVVNFVSVDISEETPDGW